MKRFRPCVWLALAVISVIPVAPLKAQTPSGDASVTKPAGSGHGLLELPGTSPLAPWEFNGSLFFSYAGSPSTEFRNLSGTVRTQFVENISSIHLGLAYGLPYNFTLEASAPYHLSAKGQDLLGARHSGGALGDTRLGVSWAIQPPGEYEIPVTIRALLGIPTGDDKRLLGEKLMYFEPQLVIGSKMAGLWWTAQGGLRFRKPNQVGEFENGQQLTWGAGAYTPIYKLPVDLGAEWTGAANLSGTTGTKGGITSVVRGEAVFWAGLTTSLVAYVGADPGLKGFGAPKYEFGGGVRWTSNGRWRDADSDGFDDDRDQCQKQPEDRDGYEDHDGCPEPDNDGDGVLDANDKCPTEMEDRDNFQDDDGCPDTDNDNDGLPDTADQCPLDPEDVDGWQDQDGCPEPDNDKDGLLDEDDKCPVEPEDRDSFEDDDGCPDLDNDKDGIPDDKDLCPYESEDFNRFQDEDGCPEGGKPYKPPPPPPPPAPLKTLDLFDTGEDDGRPKQPKPVYGTKLVESQFQFGQGSSEINAGLKDLLDDVLIVLRSNPELSLTIEAYADPETKPADRELLSKKRRDAVKDYLVVEKGVDPARVNVVEIPQPQLKGSSKTGAVRNLQLYLSLARP